MSNITLYNREGNKLEDEIVFGKSLMNFIYGNKLGLLITEKILKQKYFSIFYGNLLKKTSSKKKIRPFIEQHSINVSDILDDVESFNSFNDFFIRKLKPSARIINYDDDILISPADSRLSIYPIKDDTIFPIKGKKFSLLELILDHSLVEKYKDGLCLVFRLAPADYHRFCYIDNGTQNKVVTIGKYFHSVNPIALESNLPVFQGNYREMCELKTQNFGDVLDIDIGALGVSKIIQNNPNHCTFTKGQEKGYFEFGGSTTVLIFEKDKVQIDSDIVEHSSKGIETLIKYGSSIGKKIKA